MNMTFSQAFRKFEKQTENRRIFANETPLKRETKKTMKNPPDWLALSPLFEGKSFVQKF